MEGCLDWGWGWGLRGRGNICMYVVIFVDVDVILICLVEPVNLTLEQADPLKESSSCFPTEIRIPTSPPCIQLVHPIQ